MTCNSSPTHIPRSKFAARRHKLVHRWGWRGTRVNKHEPSSAYAFHEITRKRIHPTRRPIHKLTLPAKLQIPDSDYTTTIIYSTHYTATRPRSCCTPHNTHCGLSFYKHCTSGRRTYTGIGNYPPAPVTEPSYIPGQSHSISRVATRGK